MNISTAWNLVLLSLIFSVSLCCISPVNAQVAASSGYKLVGTIQSGDFSGAVISLSKGEQAFFRLFEKLPDGLRIVAVRDDSISLAGADGSAYTLYIAHDMQTAASAAPPINGNPPLEVQPPASPPSAPDSGTTQRVVRRRPHNRPPRSAGE